MKFPKILFFSLFGIILIFSYYVRDRKILNTLPYPIHIDERHRLDKALGILQTGDLNLHYFKKPSFPIYITAIGFLFGYSSAFLRGEIQSIAEITSISYPYFSHPRVVLAAKRLFSLLSVLALFLTGIIIYRAFDFKFLIILPSILIAFSEEYMVQSCNYINVNILGAFFVALALTFLMYNPAAKGVLKKAILPGILCGLCISCKLNLFPIYFPFFIAILIHGKSKWISYSSLMVLVSIIVFALLNPFSVLDFKTFYLHTINEYTHYMTTGHKGFSGKAGLPQFLFYMKSFIEQYGTFAFLLSLLGISYMFKRNWSNALLLLSFPLGLVLVMSMAKVHFLRNLTAAYLLWPIFITCGIYSLIRIIDYLTAFFLQQKFRHRTVFYTLSSAVICLFALTLPYGNLKRNIVVVPDSRNIAVDWIVKNITDRSVFIVPRDLQIDMRRIAGIHNLKVIDRKEILSEDGIRKYIKEGSYFLIPSYGYHPHRAANRDLASQLNSRLADIKEDVDVLKYFGVNEVLVNFTKPVPSGNPKFYLARSKI